MSTFRLGGYGLIDMAGAPPRSRELLHPLLRRWADSPAGVLIRLDAIEPSDEWTLRTAAAAAALVVAWPGTPIAVISRSAHLRELVGQDPQGHLLVIGASLPEVWGALWSPGGKANITIDIQPTIQAPTAAGAFAARACLDWDLSTLAYSAALLADNSVARSVAHGAGEIRITLSRHRSRLRVLTRDDAPSTTGEPRTINDALQLGVATPTMTRLAESLGAFDLDGHHVSWTVLCDRQTHPLPT